MGSKLTIFGPACQQFDDTNTAQCQCDDDVVVVDDDDDVGGGVSPK